MRSTLLAFSLLLAGCGGQGSMKQEDAFSANLKGVAGVDYHVWEGKGYISFEETGPARVGIQNNGLGVIELRDRRGDYEAYLIFVDQEKFTGNSWGDGRSASIKGSYELVGQDMTLVCEIQYRITPGQVLKLKQTK